MKSSWLSFASPFATAVALIAASSGCTPSGSVENSTGDVVPHYMELIGNKEKFDAAMLKCKELPTYDAMLNSEWCAVTRKADECETHHICPEK